MRIHTFERIKRFDSLSNSVFLHFKIKEKLYDPLNVLFENIPDDWLIDCLSLFELNQIMAEHKISL
jgi:hypothetical protein